MDGIKKTDIEVLRILGGRYSEIALLPVHEEKRRLWRRLNGLKPERPMVMVDQVCWNEMDHDGSLALRCEDAFCRCLENKLRLKIYQWEHFPVDMAFEPYLSVPMAIQNTRFGIAISEETQVFESENQVRSHKYNNLFQTDEDLDKIKIPKISHDRNETERRMALAHKIFDGILEVRAEGMEPYLSLWDPISTWMNVEDALFALIDRPEYMHQMLSRMTAGYHSMLDQLEDQGLLPRDQSLVHCTGAYTDELPAEGYDPEKPRCKDLWMFGLAQMLSTVSPDMFDEFEIRYMIPICERFGMVYYGCCDPLDGKIEQVRKLPGVRKISMSPWANQERGAAAIGKDFVFSSKPNPANLAMTSFNPDIIRKELTGIRQACERNGCPLEFILKDISTVRHEPERLDKWAKIAMEVAESCNSD